MRTDKYADPLPLTPDQRFFASCWLNLVHAFSLDSHRVRTMNPRNMLRELLRILDVAHANDADKTMVCSEAVLVLSEDIALKHQSFAQSTATLLHLLKSVKGKLKQDGDQSDSALMPYIARELLNEVDRSYVKLVLSLLADELLANPPVGTLAERQLKIAQLTGGLLSTLVDGGASLESLFHLYQQILVPRKPQPSYNFSRKLGLLTNLILQPAKSYRVLFAIDNVSNDDDFPTEMGGIRFANAADGWNVPAGPLGAYVSPRSRRLFAQLTVESADVRSAGSDVYGRISNILDLARFEYERERVQLADEFLVSETRHPDRVHRYAIPKVVPNPIAPTAVPDLTSFVDSVNRLLSSKRFSDEGRDRVLSAFRLYRQGADTNSFDNKLTSWWTAVEYLVRGLKSSKQIGTSVEQALTPVLCLAHAEKLLLDVRRTLVRRNLVDPVSSAPVDLRAMTVLNLFRTLCRADMQPVIRDALATEPYVQSTVATILDALADPLRYRDLLAQHEQRVRWQVMRIWRARCDIVHSATVTISGVLLCANLEFYLKTTLMNLLADLRRIQTLASPEEFFERRNFTHKQLKEDLGKQSTAALETVLANIPV